MAKPITVEDLWKLQRIGAPSLSPDGAQAVAAVTGYSMDDIQSTYLSPARQQYTNNNQVCELYETNFTGADAERLACFWGVGLEESKARIAQKVTHGGAEDVSMLLKAATSRGCR